MHNHYLEVRARVAVVLALALMSGAAMTALAVTPSLYA
jgi:hypothetical protein